MREIKLTQGKVALVDDEDFERLNTHKWCVMKTYGLFYAVRHTPKPNRRTILMHREIIGAQPGQMVDHIGGNGLNNQQANLRFCTNAQNVRNAKKRQGGTSHFKGVCYDADRGTWIAQIIVNYKGKHLGRFENEEDAAMAYNRAAKKYFGEFARLNYIPETARRGE